MMTVGLDPISLRLYLYEKSHTLILGTSGSPFSAKIESEIWALITSVFLRVTEDLAWYFEHREWKSSIFVPGKL